MSQLTVIPVFIIQTQTYPAVLFLFSVRVKAVYQGLQGLEEIRAQRLVVHLGHLTHFPLDFRFFS